MTNLRFAPEFRLQLNDVPIPAALRASISSVSLETGLEGADRVEFTLVNENLRWMDERLLGVDTKLALFLGYAPDPLEQVFVGEIVGQNAAFPSSGSPTLTVIALDLLQRFQQGTRVRWFAIPLPSVGNYPLPDLAVTAIPSAEHGLIPIYDPIGAALSVILGGVEAIGAIGDPDEQQKLIRKQTGESDFDFLKRIARESGWEMFIDHTAPLGGYKLRFMSPLSQLTPDLTLKYGQSLIDFTPRISKVGQIVSVTAYIWVAQIKTEFSVTVGWDWDRMALTLDIRPGAISDEHSGPSNYLIQDPVTAISAPRRIVSELIPKLNHRLTGSGSTIGDPRIRAGSVIQMEGLGVQFGGLYRVTSARHTLDSSGYRTSFDVRKEIWFGSIPLPQQGAVPIRATLI